MSSSPTEILKAISRGDSFRASELFAAVYEEMRLIAHAHLRKIPRGNIFSSTDLVHEVYLKLIDQEHRSWEGRTHFFAVGSRAMRQILVDRARGQMAIKRGGEFNRVELDDISRLCLTDDRHVLAIEDALSHLQEVDPVQAKIVELRFFGGMTVDEVAVVLGKSKRWVEAEWTMIRAWLKSELRGK